MNKILILGGSHRDIPLIEASKTLGYFVITLGDRDYYIGHNYSDKAYKVNFNDLDAVRKIIKDEKIDYLLPGSGEESYLNTVKLSHELNIGNFDSLEVATLVHNKWKFKEFCLQNNISTPNGQFFKGMDQLNNLTYPVVVKPTDLSGGRGVKIVNTLEELQDAISKTIDFSKEIFLEEYIEGELIAYSIVLKKQKIIYAFSGADKPYLNPYLITTAYPISLDKKITKKLDHDIEKLASLLQLIDGMFHLQLLIKDNTPYIIDVTRRIPGDLYPYLIEYSDGVKYSEAVVQSYTTGKIDTQFDHSFITQKFIVRHVVMPNHNGVIKSIMINDQLLKLIIHKLELVQFPYRVDNYLNTQLTILFIQTTNKNDAIIKNLNDQITIEYEEKDE